MAERVEPNSLTFKLSVYALVAMATTPALFYLVPPFGFLFPDGAAEVQVGICAALFVIHFLLFVLFLRLFRVLLCTARGLAILFVVDGLLLALFYSVVRAQGADQMILTIVQMPIVIVGSYYCYCAVRKLI